MDKQHVQLPNNASDLEPKDKLVYLSIRRFMNKDTKIAFPSLQTISEVSGASIPTIRKIITKLEELKYFEISKRGRGQQYKFNELKSFEPFSYEFLDKKDISFTAKSYLVASQEFMYKDVENEGKISYSDRDMSELIRMPHSTISKCNKELEALGYLTIIKNQTLELDTGCNKNTKLYHLAKLGQAVIWTLQTHEDRLNDHDSRIQKLEELVNKLTEENSRLKASKSKIPEISI
jgi:Mn-dependent DtxR family transcriptional regulator